MVQDLDELGRIAEQLEAGSFVDALVDALALWKRTRDVDVADLIDAIAAKLPPEQTPSLPKSPKEVVHAAWLKLAKKAKAAKLADDVVHPLRALLPMLYRAVPVQERVRPYYDNASKSRLVAWRTRIAALTELGDDPRMTSALVGFLRDVPFEMGDEQTGRWLYDPVIELLERLGDRRALTTLSALIESPPAKTLNLRAHLLKRLPMAAVAIEEKAKTFEAVSETLDRAAVNALRSELGGRSNAASSSKSSSSSSSEAELVQQIARGEESARAVLMDLWLERGDPRGELATLEPELAKAGRASAPDERRMRAIIRAHDKEWVGPDLARVLELRTYRSGLLDSARLASTSSANAAGWAKAARDPRLATMRSLSKGFANEKVYTEFLTSPAMTSIREVTAVSTEMLKMLSERETSRRLEVLTLEGLKIDGNLLRRLGESPNFEKLELRFVFKKAEAIAKLLAEIQRSWSAEMRRRHREIMVLPRAFEGSQQGVANWLEEGAVKLSPLTVSAELFWHPDRIRFAMRADDQGKLSLDLRTAGTAPFISVLRLLRNVNRITITQSSDKPLSKPQKLAAALEATGVSAKNTVLPTEWRKALSG